MTIIHVNGQQVEWPTAFIREDQLRMYGNQPTGSMIQTDLDGYTHNVHVIADLRFGHVFQAGEVT